MNEPDSSTARVLPSGDQLGASSDWPTVVSGRSPEPSTLTSPQLADARVGSAGPRRRRTRSAGRRARRSGSYSPAGALVTRRWSLPSAFMIQMSKSPSRSLAKAMRVPSGDHAGRAVLAAGRRQPLLIAAVGLHRPDRGRPAVEPVVVLAPRTNAIRPFSPGAADMAGGAATQAATQAPTAAAPAPSLPLIAGAIVRARTGTVPVGLSAMPPAPARSLSPAARSAGSGSR